MKKYLCIPLIVFSLYGTAQKIEQISETDIQGITILSGNSFAGEQLKVYLGNSANLYLEYGLQKLFVTEYALNNDKATLEVYIMVNAPSAFGIYSVSVSGCIKSNLFGSFSCITPYYVAAVTGPLFVYARNKTRTESGQALCEQLVKLLTDKNPQEIWYAPAVTQSAKAAPFTNTLRYYKGPLGLMKGLPFWSEMFKNIDFHMFTMNIYTPEYSGIIAWIIFPDENTFSSFIMKTGIDGMSDPAKAVQVSNGLYRSWHKINSTKILFMESNSPLADIRDFISVMPDDKWLEEKLSE
jgi:hypothetical protein